MILLVLSLQELVSMLTGGNTVLKVLQLKHVNAGSYAGGILTLDAATGTVFTHDLQAQPVGLVSITNFPVVLTHSTQLLLS